MKTALLLLLAFGAAACGAPATTAAPSAMASSAATSPCEADAIDLDQAATACATSAERTPPPPPEVLGLSMSDVEVVSGEPAELRVSMRNVGRTPLSLVFALGCSFDVVVLDAAGNVANEEGEEMLGGLCGTGAALAVTVPPGGVMTKRIAWTARRDRFVCENDECHVVPGSPIPPGTYRVELTTPFSDAVDGDEHRREARRVSAALTVRAAR